MSGRCAGVAKLLVDGERVAIGSVAVLAQDDPWPGGHRWHVTLDGEGVEDKFRIGPIGGSISQSQSRDVLFALSRYLAAHTRIEWFLNRVDQIEVERGRVRVSGVASPAA